MKPIRLDDRISAVLARDPRMLDALLGASPAFAHLRNPLVRKTMARLATVAHAARVAGIRADELLARLNQTLAGAPPPSEPIGRDTPALRSAQASALPQFSEDQIVDCDVRDDLRAGREPLRAIMAAASRVGPEGALRLRAIFEPVPLYHVLGKQGFAHRAERLAPDDWCVHFWRSTEGKYSSAVPLSHELVAEEIGMVVLDVRELEPPEPLIRTLAALEQLPRGSTLVQLNWRVPELLLPHLSERGFVHEVRKESSGLVRILIRHANT